MSNQRPIYMCELVPGRWLVSGEVAAHATDPRPAAANAPVECRCDESGHYRDAVPVYCKCYRHGDDVDGRPAHCCAVRRAAGARPVPGTSVPDVR